jgi:hypothetical protein
MNTDKQLEELNNVVDSANTLIDFIMDRNSTRQDALDLLNEIRSAAMNSIDDLTGATY